jgi:hypothetical protein
VNVRVAHRLKSLGPHALQNEQHHSAGAGTRLGAPGARRNEPRAQAGADAEVVPGVLPLAVVLVGLAEADAPAEGRAAALHDGLAGLHDGPGRARPSGVCHAAFRLADAANNPEGADDHDARRRPRARASRNRG